MDIKEKNMHFAILSILLKEKKKNGLNDRLESAFKSSLQELEDDYYNRNYDKENKRWKKTKE